MTLPLTKGELEGVYVELRVLHFKTGVFANANDSHEENVAPMVLIVLVVDDAV